MLSARPRGFTLIEVMIAVLISSALLAVGTPAFSRFIQNMQIRSITEGVQSGISLARNEAVKRNAPVTMWMVDSDTQGCRRSAGGSAWIVGMADPAGECHRAISESVAPRILHRHPVSDGGGNVVITAIGGDCLTFNSFGRLQDKCIDGSDPMTRIELRSAQSKDASTSAPTTRPLAVLVGGDGAVKVCLLKADAADPARCPAKPASSSGGTPDAAGQGSGTTNGAAPGQTS